MLFFLASYLALGAGIKYIDDAFDAKTFSKTLAIVITPFLSILGAYTMVIDSVSATILFAVLLGVLIKGKVDNIAFITGLILVVAFVFLAGVNILILPLILLSAAAVLDEVGNDLIDREKETLNKEKISNQFIMYFFGHRWILKLVILYLAVTGAIPFFFFLAMFLFDYAYITVGVYSRFKQGVIKTTPAHQAFYKIACIFK
jgi:hypothetical protein